MKTRCLPLAAILALAFALPAAWAQAAAPAPLAGASGSSAAISAATSAAPTASKPGRRTLTPAEQRENAAPLDESRPEGSAVPQISIPLGKQAPPPLKPKLRAARPDPAAPSGGVNDEVARCEAQTDVYVRAKCREWLAQQGGSR